MSTFQSVIKFVHIKIAPHSSIRDQSNNYNIDMNPGALESCPLLNEYKQKFLRSRLPQTLLGGVRVRNIPVRAVIGQLLLLFLPLLLAVVSTCLNYYADLSFLLLNGIIGITLFGLLSVIIMIPRPKTVKVAQQDVSSFRFALEEESKISVEHLLSWENFEFLFPRNKTYPYRFIDPILYAVIFTLGTEITRKSYLSTVLELSDSSYVPIYIFAWISYSVGLYPLISNAPAEVAAYKGHDAASLHHIYRPFYLLGLTGAIFVLLIIGGNVGSGQLTAMEHTQQQIVLGLYLVVCLLPLLFAAGMLPPIDCLYSWVLETWLVLFCGSTPPSCDLRGTVQVILTSVLLAVTHHISQYKLIFLSIPTALLSCNMLAFERGVYKSAKLWLAVLISALTSVSISILAAFTDIKELQSLEIVVVSLFCVSELLHMSGSVYWLGLFRNPLYPLLKSYKRAGISLRLLGRGVSILKILESITFPLLLSLYHNYLLKSLGQLTFFQTILLCRAFRKVWQDSRDCLRSTALFAVLRLCTSESTLPYSDPLLTVWLCSLGFYLLSKVRSRLHFCLKLQLDFLLLKKQRRKEALPITVLNAVLLPAIVGLVVVTAALGVPLLPLFTLPVFCVSYPRPTRFWPSATTPTYSTSNDTAFYKQITPHLLLTLTNHVTNHVTRHLTPGSFILSRVENLLIVTHVLEAGFGYASVVVKGLELQETSCHTEEVNVITDIFEHTFGEGSSSQCINGYYMHMLQPLAQTDILTYSDARNVLTGVLDSPDCLERIPKNFTKCLTYFLCTRDQHPGVLSGRVEYEGDPSVAHGAGLIMMRRTSRTGFDFTGLQSKNRTVGSEMVEDTNSTSASKNQSDDFLDNLSFNDSEDSWFDHVISNKAATSAHNTDHVIAGEADHVIANEAASSHNTEPKTSQENEDPRIHELDQVVDDDDDDDDQQDADKEMEIKVISGDGTKSSDIPSDAGESWLKVPFSKLEVSQVWKDFPQDLFHTCCKTFNFSNVLEETVKVLVSSASLAVNGNTGVSKSAYQVVKNYKGSYEWGKHSDWIKNNKKLGQLISMSYRYAVKLTIDEQIFGENETTEEFLESISDLETDWYIGLETDPDWSTQLSNSKKFLFTLGLNSEGIYSSRTLTLTKLPMFIGELNSESVRSIWSALSLELLYFTNDDEERYSIQAHPNILRNIVTQAADVPLGYPVFLSGLRHVSKF